MSRPKFVKTRNWTAVNAWRRPGGPQGGTARQKNRRERQTARRTLKDMGQ